MWKIAKYAVLGLIVLILILIGVLYWQKDNIIEAAISYAEETYDVKMAYGDTHLTLFANLPNISFEIDSVAVSHNEQKPDGDPIFNADKTGVSLSVWNVWSSPYEISDIYFINPKISLECDGSGICNYSAFAETGQEDQNPTSAESAVSFSINNLWWTGAEVVYVDSMSKQSYSIDNWDAFWEIRYLNENWMIDMNIDSANVMGTNGNLQVIPKFQYPQKEKRFTFPIADI